MADKIDGGVEGNTYDKHNSKNPIVKWLMNNFHYKIDYIIKSKSVNKILDVGCGEGHTTKIIKDFNPHIQIKGVEVGTNALETAKKLYKDIKFSQGTIYELKKPENGYDLVMSTEVLEHLEYPEQALKELKRVTKKYVLITVPNEPWWRIMNFFRGKYMKQLGNTPGHLNHWSGRSLKKLLLKEFNKVEITNALIWNIALCEVKK